MPNSASTDRAINPELLLSALEVTGVSFALYDVHERLVYCNEHYARIFSEEGTPDRIVHQPFDHIIGMAFDLAVKQGQTRIDQRAVWCEERRRRFEEASGEAVTLQLPNGEWSQIICKRLVDGYRLVLRIDVSALKQAEIAAHDQATLARKLSMVAERTDNAVVITNAEGAIEWVNEGFTRMTEYTLAEALGKKPGSLLQGQATDPAVVNLMSDAIHAGRGFKVEIINYSKSGRKYWVAVEVQPVHNQAGRLTNFVAVEADITARRELEEVLRLARDRAEAASRAKSEFLANMSHEIRTPMNGVIGMIELALHTALKPDQRRYIELARNSAQSLVTVINDILDFSRIEAGKLHIDHADFSLSKLLADTVRSSTHSAHEKNLNVLLLLPHDLPDHVSSDPVRVRQIISNLLANAIKFTEQGDIEISARYHWLEQGIGEMEIRVRDTGIGIATEKQGMIFEPFSQADASTTRKYGGTGLGLSIVTRLLKLMNGRITLDSNPGHGSVFTVYLPMAVLPATVAETEVRQALKGKTILLVDYHDKRRSMMLRWLESCGAKTQTAAHVEQAAGALQSAFFAGHAFDAVLIDAGMPDGSSLALLEMIQLMQMPTVPLTLIDADARIEATERAARAYGSTLMIKPVVRCELCQTLASLLGHEITMSANIQANEKIRTTPAPGPSTVQRALLVEDNPVNRMVAETMLTQFGIEVHAAENGLEALELYEQWPYDMIFMDLQMPVMDGLEATTIIRQQEHDSGKHTPIIALTANAMEGDRERCLEGGMDGYLAKPITLERLGAEIERVLKLVS